MATSTVWVTKEECKVPIEKRKLILEPGYFISDLVATKPVTKGHGLVTVHPHNHTDIENSVIVVATNESCVVACTCEDKPIRHMRFDGTEWTPIMDPDYDIDEDKTVDEMHHIKMFNGFNSFIRDTFSHLMPSVVANEVDICKRWSVQENFGFVEQENFIVKYHNSSNLEHLLELPKDLSEIDIIYYSFVKSKDKKVHTGIYILYDEDMTVESTLQRILEIAAREIKSTYIQTSKREDLDLEAKRIFEDDDRIKVAVITSLESDLTDVHVFFNLASFYPELAPYLKGI